ncbi:general transcription factor 3C polypeptide 6 isoform 2-T3 [Pholidichthys leucotaenia]
MSLTPVDDHLSMEQLVVVELSGIINNDFLAKSGGSCKILEIDSERPMMQVGPYVFAGTYEDTLGTSVLFEEVPGKGKSNRDRDLKYLCHTERKLTMQRIFLTEKREGETSIGNADDAQQMDTSCLSNQEEKDNQQDKTEEDMDSPCLEESAAD